MNLLSLFFPNFGGDSTDPASAGIFLRGSPNDIPLPHGRHGIRTGSLGHRGLHFRVISGGENQALCLPLFPQHSPFQWPLSVPELGPGSSGPFPGAAPGGRQWDGPSLSSMGNSSWGSSSSACGLSSETVRVPEAVRATPAPRGVTVGPQEVGSQTAAGSSWNQPQTQ